MQYVFPTLSGSQQGTSLLEVLIALALLSLGLLGFAEAELTALRQDQIAFGQSVSAVQVGNMADQLRACNDEQQRAASCLHTAIADWQQQNSLLLPRANSSVSAQGGDYILKINWQTALRTGKNLDHQFVFEQLVQP